MNLKDAKTLVESKFDVTTEAGHEAMRTNYKDLGVETVSAFQLMLDRSIDILVKESASHDIAPLNADIKALFAVFGARSGGAAVQYILNRVDRVKWNGNKNAATGGSFTKTAKKKQPVLKSAAKSDWRKATRKKTNNGNTLTGVDALQKAILRYADGDEAKYSDRARAEAKVLLAYREKTNFENEVAKVMADFETED